jgi:hypothetical protein
MGKRPLGETHEGKLRERVRLVQGGAVQRVTVTDYRRRPQGVFSSTFDENTPVREAGNRG